MSFFWGLNGTGLHVVLEIPTNLIYINLHIYTYGSKSWYTNRNIDQEKISSAIDLDGVMSHDVILGLKRHIFTCRLFRVKTAHIHMSSF